MGDLPPASDNGFLPDAVLFRGFQWALAELGLSLFPTPPGKETVHPAGRQEGLVTLPPSSLQLADQILWPGVALSYDGPGTVADCCPSHGPALAHGRCIPHE